MSPLAKIGPEFRERERVALDRLLGNARRKYEYGNDAERNDKDVNGRQSVSGVNRRFLGDREKRFATNRDEIKAERHPNNCPLFCQVTEGVMTLKFFRRFLQTPAKKVGNKYPRDGAELPSAMPNPRIDMLSIMEQSEK